MQIVSGCTSFRTVWWLAIHVAFFNRRLLHLAGWPLWLLGSFLVAAAAQPPREELQIRLLDAVDATQFPQVTVRFCLLDSAGRRPRQLPEAELIILEDGVEVHRLQTRLLEPPLGKVVLVFDTSGSMLAANKLVEGKRAAERFFANLAASTPCGLVLFHHEVYLREGPRLERSSLLERVKSASAGGGTAWMDAAVAALDLLPETTREQRHAVVLLTDGRDVNSRHALADVIAAARRRQVAFYPVGLGQPGRLQPVRTALVLDRSGSMSDGGKMASLKKAAQRFVELMPNEGADTILLAFNDQIEFLLDPVQFTAAKPQLLQAIDRLTPAGETRLWDAVVRGLKVLDASRAGLSDPPRLALIALTDGIDNRSDTRRIDVVIESARRLNIPVYMLGLGPRHSLRENEMREVAVRTGGQFYHIPHAGQLTDVFERLSIDLHDDGIDERSLRRLAEQTGGEYCDVRQADRLCQTFERLAIQVDNTYSVTFRSRRDRADGTARGIEIRFGELARTISDYKTYGLITPLNDAKVYLSTLAVLLLLLFLPRLRHK